MLPLRFGQEQITQTSFEKCKFAKNTCLSLPKSAKLLTKCQKKFAQIYKNFAQILHKLVQLLSIRYMMPKLCSQTNSFFP